MNVTENLGNPGRLNLVKAFELTGCVSLDNLVIGNANRNISNSNDDIVIKTNADLTNGALTINFNYRLRYQSDGSNRFGLVNTKFMVTCLAESQEWLENYSKRDRGYDVWSIKVIDYNLAQSYGVANLSSVGETELGIERSNLTGAAFTVKVKQIKEGTNYVTYILIKTSANVTKRQISYQLDDLTKSTIVDTNGTGTYVEFILNNSLYSSLPNDRQELTRVIGDPTQMACDKMPVGSVIMWAGDLDKIPYGWVLMENGYVNDLKKNGFNIPNMVGKFPTGVTKVISEGRQLADYLKSNTMAKLGDLGSNQEGYPHDYRGNVRYLGDANSSDRKTYSGYFSRLTAYRLPKHTHSFYRNYNGNRGRGSSGYDLTIAGEKRLPGSVGDVYSSTDMYPNISQQEVYNRVTNGDRGIQSEVTWLDITPPSVGLAFIQKVFDV